MSGENLALSLFFPCHNEEANVERMTLSALQTCPDCTPDFEIIIVNDGSTDRTGEIAESLVQRYSRVRVVHHATNLGYGAALQSGLRAAKKEWIFYTDGDGQFDLAEMPRVLSLRGERVIVSAYRLRRQDSILRRLNGWGWSRLVNAVFELRVRDIDCAFKLFPARLFKEIELRSTGALIDTEILAKASRLGYHIVQLGVNHYPRQAGRQSGASIKVIVRAFRELFRLRGHIIATIPKQTG